MQTTPIKLRRLHAEDIEAALYLSREAGWNQTERDWKFLLNDQQNICVAAISDGNVIGTTVALDYNGQMCWIGMVLVNKAYRGRGISKLLLQYIFENYTAPAKLDATALGEPVYKKFGFLPEYTIVRMVNAKNENDFAVHSPLLQPATANHISDIIALDEISMSFNRSKLIQYYLQHFAGKACVLKENNRVEGFVLGREGYRYYHIGPLVAATVDQAALLLKQALEKLSGQPVVIDVPADKKVMIQLLETFGFVEQRRFVRMYKEQNPFAGNTSHQFAIAGPEFG